MGKKLITILVLISLGHFAFAQSLVPATSEDLSAFDQQIAQSESKKSEAKPTPPAKKSKNSNFGANVSQKAKELKNEDLEQKKKMGQWVSDQRAKDDEKTPANAQGKGQGVGSSNSSSKDVRGNSPNAPGRKGTAP